MFRLCAAKLLAQQHETRDFTGTVLHKVRFVYCSVKLNNLVEAAVQVSAVHVLVQHFLEICVQMSKPLLFMDTLLYERWFCEDSCLERDMNCSYLGSFWKWTSQFRSTVSYYGY